MGHMTIEIRKNVSTYEGTYNIIVNGQIVVECLSEQDVKQITIKEILDDYVED